MSRDFMDRRRFLGLAGGAGIALGAAGPALAPSAARAATYVRTASAGWRSDRTLVLVELAGGNDGLNTVVPFKDPAYYRLRPGISVPSELVEDLDGTVGLHPALRSLLTPWEARDLAVVLGVGSGARGTSHGGALEAWESGQADGEPASAGWITRVLGGRAAPADLVAGAIVLGGRIGPVRGTGLRVVIARDADRAGPVGSVASPGAGAANPALSHARKVRQEIEQAAARLAVIQSRAPDLGVRFPRDILGRQMEVAARLLAAGAKVPVVKVALGGFDTHRDQPTAHARLLKQLGGALVAFRAAMVNSDSWRRVLVMTYSEFGRGARENRHRGTDHGAAAAHLVLGGGVKGGVYGRQPSLTGPDGGAMRPTVDFRRLYTTAAEGWWGVKDARPLLGGHAPIDILES